MLAPHDTLVSSLAGGLQLLLGTRSDCLDAHPGQHGPGRSQLLTRLKTPSFAPQPLAVAELRAGEVGPQSGASQPLNRFAVKTLGGLALA